MRRHQAAGELNGKTGVSCEGVNHSLTSVNKPMCDTVPQLVLWCEQVNLHYAAWLRALARLNMFSVRVIAGTLITPERKQLGWQTSQVAPAEVVIARTVGCIDDALSACDANAVHIVEGIRGSSIARNVLKRLIASKGRIGVISEGCDTRGLLGIVRRCLYKGHIWRMRERIDFVLGMGECGVKWYSSCGVPLNRVFPFMYTAETPSESTRANVTHARSDMVRVVYLGQCIKRKGIRDLLDAVAELGNEKVSLSVIGDGDLRASLEEHVSRRPILRGRVSFTGVLPYHEAVESISDFDLLVLPSHFDGWGVVVNEALMQGVPVVCSDMCGSKDLLAEAWRGGVFRSGCARSLTRELNLRVQSGPIPDQQREKLRTWSRRLYGERIAEYFVSILAHLYSDGTRPEPPWTS